MSIGTLPLIRTEKTSPFERDDFTNLSSRVLLVAQAGLEPATHEFSVHCSTIGAIVPYKTGCLFSNYKFDFFNCWTHPKSGLGSRI